MDAEVQTALTDVESAGRYLCLTAEPAFLSVEGARDLGAKMVRVAEDYQRLTRAYGMLLAELATVPPQDRL